MFRDTCFLSKKDGFVLEWYCRKILGLQRWVASWVSWRHSNDSIETVASTPSDLVKAVVRGRIGAMESPASTPPGFVEAVVSEKSGIALGFHRRIERLTMLNYPRNLSACHPSLLCGARVSRAKLRLHLEFRLALRARLFGRSVLIDCSV